VVFELFPGTTSIEDFAAEPDGKKLINRFLIGANASDALAVRDEERDATGD
jgi:hypothetical protein